MTEPESKPINYSSKIRLENIQKRLTKLKSIIRLIPFPRYY